MQSSLARRLLLVALCCVPSRVALGESSATDWSSAGRLGDFASVARDGRGWVVTSTNGRQLRLTPYGNGMMRVQAVDDGQEPFADDRYESVARHDFSESWSAADEGDSLHFTPDAGGGGAEVLVHKSPLQLEFRLAGDQRGRLFEDVARSNQVGGRALELRVNGTVVNFRQPFPGTTSWERWADSEATAVLRAGVNVVRLTANGESGPNIDYLAVEGVNGRFEAEAARLGGVVRSSANGGFSGSGYGDFQNDEGDYIEWTVEAPAAGARKLRWRYANGTAVAAHFVKAAGEHFAGLGHGAFGRVAKLDLAGQIIERNRELQAPLLVPFFLSSRGYGIFVNDPHPNRFAFRDDDFSFALAGGRLDFFFIAGPRPADVLDRYTQLTGRPSLPPLSAFTLGFSDKLNDTLPSDEEWWHTQLARLKAGGWPTGVLVHDNGWRGGKTAPWEWNVERYPDPSAFADWTHDQGVVNFLDFNRADAPLSAGWEPSFALPGTTDWPDFSVARVRQWFWELVWSKAFDPALGYPGDFLWLDEFDEPVAPTGLLHDGRDWNEHANDYFLLLAKAVGEGWEDAFHGTKRPFFMSRGMSAGGQRWASLWSGDLEVGDAEMRLEVRGMLAAGLSGFPFWGHDAGGFKALPTDSSYRRWGLAFGSFAPLWKPHGLGLRFPWQFSAAAQEDARTYGRLRMQLMPYIYSAAFHAHETGLPMARAMLFEYPDRSEAWAADQQYFWGDSLLVAPDTAAGAGIWLPPGKWFDFWDDQVLAGNVTIARHSTGGRLPLYVKAGAIIPKAGATLTLAEADAATREVDIYAGADGRFELVDDDGITAGYQTGAVRRTIFNYDDGARELVVGAGVGSYPGAPRMRDYWLRFHGETGARPVKVNGVPLPVVANEAAARRQGRGVYWDGQLRLLVAHTGRLPVDETAAMLLE